MGLTDINTQSISFNTLVINDSETAEVLRGLRQTPKTLPPKYFYDQRGSLLFDQICDLEAYYLTRTETAILEHNIREIAAMVGCYQLMIEFGSGSSLKTRLMLDHLPELATYIPVDISRQHLYQTAEHLRLCYPNLMISPLWADFTRAFSLPPLSVLFDQRLAYFPGSTLGNFYPHQTIEFMRNVAALVGPGGGFLIGLDLQKDSEILNLAYNDPQGITAAFNRNILRHINRKFGATFDERQFEHLAFYNPTARRIEMHLISQSEQVVQINGTQIHFRCGENILTEVSCKYTIADFAKLAQQAGFRVQKVWVDAKNYFSVQYLVAQ